MTNKQTSPTWWVPDLARRTGPIYRVLAEAIAEAVQDGRLQAGDRLAPHRVMAERLGVDLTTVTRAYGEALRQGLVEATPGRGTFIRSEAPLLKQRGRDQSVVDMSMNLPPLPADPSLRDMIQAGIARMLRKQDLSALMTYHWDTGTADDRTAGAAWLRPCLDRVDAQRVLVCPGAQSGLLAVLTTLARPGEIVLTEHVTYPGIRALAAQLGITLAGVRTDEEGFLPDALDRACTEFQPRLIYCNPTIQNPTTSTMSMARREVIAAIARAHAIPILEDDAYGLYPQSRLPALAAFAPELVFYLATTAKTLTPGLRIAYLVAPSQAQAERLRAGLRGTVQMGSGLLTGLVTQWIRSGEAELLLDAIRKETRERQLLADAFLGGSGSGLQTHPEGPHAWLRLPRHWRPPEFVAYVRRQGLALVPEEVFRVDGPPPNAVRIALGAATTRDDLTSALRFLHAVVQRPVPAAYVDIV